MEKLNLERVSWIITQAFEEDLGAGDFTTSAVVERDRAARAKIVAKQSGVICGLQIAERVFQTRDPNLQVDISTKNGVAVEPGATVITITGSGRSILEAERTALNLIGRMSGIATLARRFVEAVAGTNTIILDTRKTAPLLRELDKYAVRAGGAQNHRLGLFDMVLIKDNHIRYAGGIEQALTSVFAQKQRDQNEIKVEIEVRDLDELQQAMRFPVNRIMIDNFSLADMKRAVEIAQGRVQLEASGGVTLETVGEIARTGVDFISVGLLTHSVKNFDFSLLFE